MNKHAAWFVLAALAYGAPAHALDLTAEAALVSDYRWRGLSLSDEDPSLQLETHGAFDTGAWLWGALSSVSDAVGGAELGVGVGYDTEFATLDWSLGVTGYAYAADNLDYVEINLSAGKAFGPFSLSAGVDYMPEQDNLAEAYPYLWLGAGAQLGRFDIYGHVGRDDGLIKATGQTLDYALGASTTFARWSADFSFVESQADDSAWVLRLSHAFAR